MKDLIAITEEQAALAESYGLTPVITYALPRPLVEFCKALEDGDVAFSAQPKKKAPKNRGQKVISLRIPLNPKMPQDENTKGYKALDALIKNLPRNEVLPRARIDQTLKEAGFDEVLSSLAFELEATEAACFLFSVGADKHNRCKATGKVCFRSYKQAERTASDMRRRYRGQKHAPYHCKSCDQFHVGREYDL